MKAIVVTDQAAGTAGMTLVERPEPQAAINDVVVANVRQRDSSRLSWRGPRPGPIASTVTEDRQSPGIELGGSGHRPRLWRRRKCRWDSRCSASRTGIATAPWRSTRPSSAPDLAPLPGDVDFTVGPSLPISGLTRVAGTVRARPPSGGAERPCARRGRRGQRDGDATGRGGRRLRHGPRTPRRQSDGARLRFEGSSASTTTPWKTSAN